MLQIKNISKQYKTGDLDYVKQLMKLFKQREHK